MKEYFAKGISLFHLKAKSQKEVLDKIAEVLFEKGIVEEEFRDQLEEHEACLPTALNVNGYGVAIPHTESHSIKESQIAFVSLEEPVDFKEMGSEKLIKVQLLFVMALKNNFEQIETFQNIIKLFQNEERLEQFEKVDCQTDLDALIESNVLA